MAVARRGVVSLDYADARPLPDRGGRGRDRDHPDGKTAYAVTLDNSTLTTIDLTTGTVGTPITVG